MPRSHHYRNHHHCHQCHHHCHHHHYRPQIITQPVTSASTIVFSYKKGIWKFDTSSYDPKMTNGRVSLDEINQLLDEVIVPVNKYIDKLLLYRYTWLIPIIVILMPLLLIYAFYECFTESCRRKAEIEMKKKVRAILKEKGSHFTQRGLRWVVPARFPDWIELWTGEEAKQKPIMTQQQMMAQNNGAMVGQNG